MITPRLQTHPHATVIWQVIPVPLFQLATTNFFPHTLPFALTLQINVDRIAHLSPSLTIIPVSALCSSAPSLQSRSHFFISLPPLHPSPYIQLLSGKKSSQYLPQIEPSRLLGYSVSHHKTDDPCVLMASGFLSSLIPVSPCRSYL